MLFFKASAPQEKSPYADIATAQRKESSQTTHTADEVKGKKTVIKPFLNIFSSKFFRTLLTSATGSLPTPTLT